MMRYKRCRWGGGTCRIPTTWRRLVPPRGEFWLTGRRRRQSSLPLGTFTGQEEGMLAKPSTYLVKLRCVKLVSI